MIPPEELKIQVWPKRQTGGQMVTIRSTGVKVTHIPTGTKAVCDMARYQHANRAIAIEMIEQALTHPWSRR